MTTTKLINLLKSVEKGASNRARNISIRINNELYIDAVFKIESTGDGIAGAQLLLSVDDNKK